MTPNFRRSLAFLLSALMLSCSALIYDKVSDLPHVDSYDYVVIGGGTAGCVVANRLTENKNVNVLVIEAGPSNRGRPSVTVPYLLREAFAEPFLNWNTSYIPMPGVNGRVIDFFRGHVLGGSSSINGMVYTRGTAEGYDRYAAVSGDPGWSWEGVQYYIKKNELFSPSVVAGYNATGRYNPDVHSSYGITGTGVNGYLMDTDNAYMQVTKDAADEFPFDQDYNSGVAHGISWLQYTIQNGTRVSSAWSYLADKYLARPNLNVLVNATVLRVLQSSKGGAVGTVEFLPSANNGTVLHTKVSREIILSAGTAGSPYLLLKSGIGDAKTLSALNISVIANLPSVGQNLTEQTELLNARWNTTSNDTFQNILETLTAEALAQWNYNRTGPFAAGAINNIVLLRMNASDPTVQQMVKKYGDPSSGPNSPHFEILPINGFPGLGPLIDITSMVLNPLSRGSLILNASNPLGPPVLDAGFYTNPMDMFVHKQAVLAGIRLMSQPAFSNYVIKPFPEFASIFTANGTVDDQLLETFIRNNAQSNTHAVGTNAMSPCGAQWGVVDPDMKVKGLKGLRVVDASVIPFVPSGHSQAAVYVFAERASDLIKTSL